MKKGKNLTLPETEFVVFEECPLEMCAKRKLQPQTDEDGWIYAYYCPKCHNYWNLEDLKVEEVEIPTPQKTLDEFFK